VYIIRVLYPVLIVVVIIQQFGHHLYYQSYGKLNW